MTPSADGDETERVSLESPQSRTAERFSRYLIAMGSRPLDLIELRWAQDSLFSIPPRLPLNAPPLATAAAAALGVFYEAVNRARTGPELEDVAQRTEAAIDDAVNNPPPGVPIDLWAAELLTLLIP